MNIRCRIIRLYLEQEDFTVYTALNATEGLRLIESIEPDVVLQCRFSRTEWF